MARLTLCSIILAVFVSSTIANIPKHYKVCGRQNLNECAKDTLDKLRKKLQQGIPELGVIPMEPLDIDEVALADIPDFRTVATNVKLYGIPNYVIEYLNVDLDNQKIDLQILIPRIDMKSDLNVKAKIMVPISEKAPIDIVTENVVVKMSLKIKTVNRRGRQLVYFPKMNLKLMITDYEANFNPGADVNFITQAINAVLVDSKKEIIDSLTPNLEKALSVKILDTANKLCKNFTYDELFPIRT